MKSNHTTIYIETDEEITSIIERIKKTPANEIALVVPINSSLAQGIVNLKILKSQSEKIGKKLMLITRDSSCRALAEKVGLTTGKKLDSETLKRTKVDAPVPADAVPNKSILSPPLAPSPPSPSPLPTATPSSSAPPRPSALPTPPIAPVSKPTLIQAKIQEPINKPVKNQIDLSRPKPSIDGAGPSPSSTGKSLGDINLKPPAPEIKTGLQTEIKKEDFDSSRIIPDQPVTKIPKEKFDIKPIIKTSQDKLLIYSKKIQSLLKESLVKLKKEFFDKKTSALSLKKGKPKKEKPVSQRDVVIRSLLTGHSSGKRRIKQMIFLPKANIKIFGWFALVAVIIISLAAAFTLPKAIIEIIPKKELIVLENEVVASLNQSSLDLKSSVIPAREIETDIEEEGEFKPTGSGQGSVSGDTIQGQVVVYNEFSSSKEILIPNTRFTNDNGLVYKSASSINIPGYTSENGDVVPGQVTITIVAEKSGNEYALSSNEKLMIPGLKGDERYDKIYALVAKPITLKEDESSSNSDKNRVIQKNDIIEAKEIVEATLKEKAQEKIQAKNPELFIDKESIVLNDIQFDVSDSPGDSVETFKVTAKTRAKAISFKNSDLTKLLEAYLNRRTPRQQKLLGSPTVEVMSTQLKPNKQDLELNVKIEEFSIKEMNTREIQAITLGLSKKEAYDQVISLSQVEDAKVKCWPFWVRSIPNNESRVEVVIKE